LPTLMTSRLNASTISAAQRRGYGSVRAVMAQSPFTPLS
jgi:hypothetical protein